MSEATSIIAKRLGRRGGKATLKKYGPEYFKRLRQLAVKAKKERQRRRSKKEMKELGDVIGGISGKRCICGAEVGDGEWECKCGRYYGGLEI